VSVVVPVYNEAEVLPLFVARLRPVLEELGEPYEALLVDDGSTDLTPVLLERLRRDWPELRVVRLRANAGHQAALSAGLDRARGDWVVTLDADLQDPPELIGQMLAIGRAEQVDVVYGVRTDRSSDSTFKRVSARTFYRAMARLSHTSGPKDAGDYRLMSRATVDAVVSLPQHHQVLRLVVPALDFPSSQVGYARSPRAAGSSKYPLSRMLRLTVDSMTGFSVAPLRLATWFGLGGGTVALLLLLYAVIARLRHDTVAGWTSTIVIVSAFGAVQLLCLGLLGEYVGRLYTQMQGRPAYFVATDSADRGPGPTPTGLDGVDGVDGVDGEGQGLRARTSNDTPGSRPTGR
jgi:glycosyltransferase involved in cell wall biosynthesis